MFFIMGISDKIDQLRFDQLTVCPVCGSYGHLRVYMAYTYFMFFFIPLFKWNRRYYARMECCGAQAELDPRLGKAIADGSITYLNVQMLRFSRHDAWGGQGSQNYGGAYRNAGNTGTAGSGYAKQCRYCGYSTTEDFEYCPKCGRRFD